jgi:hypothetical protein
MNTASLFDPRNKPWTLDSGYENNNRIKDYELFKEVKIQKSSLPGIINTKASKSYNFCDINISQRIGMESTMSEVYKINLNNQFAAVKILPILNDKSMSNNEKEIRFALEASELILSGESKYFPIVYDFMFCEETHFYKGENLKGDSFSLRFYDKSLRYQKFQALYRAGENAIDEIVSYKRKFLEPEKIKEILQLNVSLPNKVQSHLLISELAPFDLDYYFNEILSSKLCLSEYRFKIYHLLKYVFLAIQDLQIKLNLLHNDLHLGNILMVKDDSSEIGYIPVIHDFGKSRKITRKGDKINHFDKEHDLFFFLGKFEEKTRMFELELEVLIDVFNESKEMYPIINVVDYWNNLRI